jgi:MT0933-like antitoxin protein
MSFLDNVVHKVRVKADEWEVQAKAEKFVAEVERAAHQAKDKAAEYADDHRDQVREALDKAGAKIDERTEGKYSDRISKAKVSVLQGVEKLAEQRPDHSDDPAAAAPSTSTAGTTNPTRRSTTDAWAQATASTTSQAASPATSPAGTPQDAPVVEPQGAETYAPEPYTPDPIDPSAPIDSPLPSQGATESPTGWPQDAPRDATPPPPAQH